MLAMGGRRAIYLMHSCPRCKHFLDVVVGDLRVGKTTRSVRGVCVRCWYQLSWKLIPGRLLRHPVRSISRHAPNPHKRKPAWARWTGSGRGRAILDAIQWPQRAEMSQLAKVGIVGQLAKIARKPRISKGESWWR